MAKDYGARPALAPEWYKAHGLGNDYLVFEQGGAWTAEPESVGRVCHRLEGVGGDGIVAVRGAAGEPFPLRMFNPDGSEFERSGNGLRVLAAYLHHSGRVAEAPFEVECGGDRIRMQVHSRSPLGLYDIEVEMGRARVGAEAVGLDPAALDRDGRIAHPEGARIPLVPVSVGNPHAVVFADDAAIAFDVPSWHRFAPGIVGHPAFRDGTNAQLVRVVAPRAIEILIWERGVGPTTASGTSACATAVASVRSGRVEPGEVEVRMEGGSFRVKVGPDLDVVLRGPVQEVGTGVLSAGFVRGLAGAR